MSQSPTIEISELIDNQRLRKFHVVAVALCLLVFFVDGLDFGSANVAGPAIIRAFHSEKSAMGVVFSWGYFGLLIGSLLFGYIGDRFGRKIGVISGVLTYSLPAVAAAFAVSLHQLAVLRFLAGLGIGGVIPSTVALLTETAPRRFRASFVMLASFGYSCGNATIGQVAARFIPRFDWPVVFLVAGLAGTFLAIVLAFLLPESVRFLALTKRDSPELRRAISRLAPELSVALAPDTQFFLREEARKKKFSIKLLFSGSRRFSTPLWWLAYFAEALTFMTLSSWLTTLLEGAGLRPTQASLTFSYAALAAVVAVLLLARPLDKFGPMATVVSALIAVAATIYLGSSGLSTAVIVVVAIISYACCAGTHQSLNATVGIFYPTTIRGNGVGYATAMGRVSSIFGPLITGYLLSAKLPLREILLLIAGPYLVLAIACFALGLIYRQQLSGDMANDFEAVEPVEATNSLLSAEQ